MRRLKLGFRSLVHNFSNKLKYGPHNLVPSKKIKIIVINYSFNLQKFKTIVNNYYFDKDVIVCALF